MAHQSRNLKGLVPEPNEPVESFIKRGQTVAAETVLEFRPQEGDSLGEYLLRLRVNAGLLPEDVETRSKGFPENVALNRADVAKLESGDLDLVTEKRLRTLATLYGVPQDWVLQIAQYPVHAQFTALPAMDNAYATLTMRSAEMNTLDAETRQTLDKIFDEIVSALQGARHEQPSGPSPSEE